MPGKAYGPGGKWIHDRAREIMKDGKTPEPVAYAVATQQAHKVDKSPKSFRTAVGVAEARAKYDRPKSEYQKTAQLVEVLAQAMEKQALSSQLLARAQKAAISRASKEAITSGVRQRTGEGVMDYIRRAVPRRHRQVEAFTRGLGRAQQRESAALRAFELAEKAKSRVGEAALRKFEQQQFKTASYWPSFMDELQKISQAPGSLAHRMSLGAESPSAQSSIQNLAGGGSLGPGPGGGGGAVAPPPPPPAAGGGAMGGMDMGLDTVTKPKSSGPLATGGGGEAAIGGAAKTPSASDLGIPGASPF